MSDFFIQIGEPFRLFHDIDGQPLEDGYIYVGEAGLDPVSNPIDVYSDEALTLNIPQPIRTIGGYPVNQGTPTKIFIPLDYYSIRVLNKRGTLIYTDLSVRYTQNLSGIKFESLQEAANENLTGLNVATTLGFYGGWSGAVGGPRGGATYYRDGTVGAPSTIYADNSGFFDKDGAGFRIEKLSSYLMSQFGDPVDGTDARVFMQYCIDYLAALGGGDAMLDIGVHGVGAETYVPFIGGLAIRGLVMKNGVNLLGFGNESLIKVIDSLYGPGAFYNGISSNDVPGAMLRNCTLDNFSMDGNQANQAASTQCSNILLYSERFVHVRRVLSYNSNGQGIQLVGATSNSMTDCSVIDNDVSACNGIGIQCSQFSRLTISENRVSVCTDNCVDVYGEDGDTTTHGFNSTITGNVCDGGNGGIFLETVQDMAVDGNTVNNCTVGIVANRINGEPLGLEIGDANVISTCDTGILLSGDTGGVKIGDLFIRAFTVAGIQLGTGGGNLSYAQIGKPVFKPAATSTPIYLVNTSGQVAFCRSDGGFVLSDGHDPAKLLEIAGGGTFINNRFGTPECVPTVGDGNNLCADFIGSLRGETGLFRNTAGPVTITIPDNSTGYLWVDATQGGVGRVLYRVPYMKVGSTLSIATPVQDIVVAADPITSITVVGNDISVALLAANTYVVWYVQQMRLF